MFRVAIADEFGLAGTELQNLLILAKKEEFEFVGTISKNVELFIRENNIEILFYLLYDAEMRRARELQTLIKKFPDTYFLAVSSHTDFNIVRTVFRAGIYDYLALPLSEEDLSEVLGSLSKNYYRKYLSAPVIHKFDALIQNIFQGGGNERAICEAIIDEICANTISDPIAAQITLQNAKEKIYLDMIYQKPWLEKFTLSRPFLVPTAFSVGSKEEFLDAWDRDFSEIGKVVKKYQMVDNRLIYHIGKYIVMHVDERLSLDDLSDRLHLNKTYISHIFKKVSGMGLVDFQLNTKIDRAKILLHDEEWKISEIADQIGYSNVEYFRKIFRDITSMTPSEYRALVIDPSEPLSDTAKKNYSLF
jgi:two-component system response regulator YesN